MTNFLFCNVNSREMLPLLTESLGTLVAHHGILRLVSQAVSQGLNTLRIIHLKSNSKKCRLTRSKERKEEKCYLNCSWRGHLSQHKGHLMPASTILMAIL